MKPGRIIVMILLVGALSYGYWRSMQPIVKYDVVAQPAGVCEAMQDKTYGAEVEGNELYATAMNPHGFVKIQGVYHSPRDGALEVAVFARELAEDEPCGWSRIRIKLPPSRWPEDVVFRDVTGEMLARVPVAGTGVSAP